MEPRFIDAANLVSMLKKSKPAEVMKFIKGIYIQGYSDGEHGNKDGYYLPLRSVSYECDCPVCNSRLELDLKDLAERVE